MLDAYIIEQIKKEAEKRDAERPRLQLEIPVLPVRRPEDERSSDDVPVEDTEDSTIVIPICPAA